MAVKAVINQSLTDLAINQAAQIRRKKTTHGSKGERLVLRNLRANAQYKKVVHASLKNQRLGYDIRTIDTQGNQEFHEVKSSSKKNFAPSTWYIARKQYEMAKANLKKYFFWFVNALNSSKATIQKFRPDELKFKASRFQVAVSPHYKATSSMEFDADSLVKELDSKYQSPRTCSVREKKNELENRQLIAQAVLTRKFLAEELVNYKKARMTELDYNCGQVNSQKPYHLKYTDKDGKKVYVDLKVHVDENSGPFTETTFRFNVTKNRRDQAMSLKHDSDHRREFWYCCLDKESKKLYVRVYNVSGKDFWNSVKNRVEPDYYSFKLKT